MIDIENKEEVIKEINKLEQENEELRKEILKKELLYSELVDILDEKNE